MQKMRFTQREFPDVRSLVGQAVALVVLVALFAFAGPFGTYDSIGHLGRLGYWSLAMGANWLVCGSVSMLTLHLTESISWRLRLVAIAGVAGVAAVPGTGVVFLAEQLFRPEYSGRAELGTIYISVALLMMVIGTSASALSLARFSMNSVPGGTLGKGDEGADRAARFLDRLPARLGRDLVYLKMADHYVEAFTIQGSTLVLMRFSDAIAELEGANGLQVHRSYWIARRHVASAERKDGRTVLRLTGGHEVPVSRSYQSDVRAAGLA